MKCAAARYLPFAVLLVGFLGVAYIVNSRSYLIREGYYAFGSHAVLNALHYIVALYVGKRTVLTYVLIAVTVTAVVLRGTMQMRFFLLWILVTLLPVLFFTWGIASRYLYVPAAGFTLFLAEVLTVCEARATRWAPQRIVRPVVTVAAIALAVRFGIFAQKGVDAFRERTRPYERLVSAITTSSARMPADGSVYVSPEAVENVPALYWNPAAEEALCTPDVRLVVR